MYDKDAGGGGGVGGGGVENKCIRNKIKISQNAGGTYNEFLGFFYNELQVCNLISWYSFQFQQTFFLFSPVILFPFSHL